ncbi:hypothetical protein AQUCO_02000535v1 [Aquilegia coerulea]|uniref:Stress-response A/B barrel domain-containing protein n=1 Tax=Aquilegia coerulea TaxID=218851 RepID=A0A2G5DI35_AQUCA|nr:hypothetical protein AQUCO_02000535v1 [Aquilegia coerulea]
MSQTVEHIVLFKVKDNTDSSKIKSMVDGLNSLISLDKALYLSTGPILRNQSPSLGFTHMLHGRFKSIDNLVTYLSHPTHTSVLNELVDPICDDLILVDWVGDVLDEPLIIPPSGVVLKVSLLKLKEGLGESEKAEVLKVIGDIKKHFGSTYQFTFGENIAQVRTNGYSIASLAIFPGISEMEALDTDKVFVKEQKEKIKDFLESAIIVDYELC